MTKALASDAAFLAGDGEMARLLRAHDWSATTLGPPNTWSQSLRTVVRLMLNTGHPMCIFWGEDGACLYNEGFRQSVGEERHPASLGRPVREVWAEVWDIVGSQIEDAMSGRRATWQENALVPITRNGRKEQVYWTYSYSPIDDEAAPNGVGGVLVVCSDTTRTVLMEAASRHSEEQLRLATENAEVGLWDVDLVTDTLYWPPRVKALFGISPDVPVSMADFYAGLHPDDLGPVTQAFAEAADPSIRATYDVEYRTIGKEDGVVRWVAAKGRGIFDAAGVCVRAIGTAVNITERKHAEQNLRELNDTLERRVADGIAERRLLAEIVESTDALIMVVDPGFGIMAINRACALEFERVYGVPPKTGDNLLGLLDDQPGHRGEVEDMWSRALTGEVFTAVAEFGDPQLDRRSYELKFNVIRDADGQVVGAYQFVYDVTEQLVHQARLVEAEEQLRQAQKMEAVGQLTGGIAHDFNNMLAVVIGSLDLLNRRIGDADARARHYVTAATEGAKRAANLTQRLLAFSRQQPLRPETLNLNRLVPNMSELLKHSLGAGVRLETVLAAGLWSVEADPNQLENVIINLGVNARDAMPDGGRLTIETQNAHLDARYVKSEVGVPAGQYVMIAVTDTGCGMAPEVIAKAFDPFFTTKDIGKGTGLGLSQVYGFVKQSGGHIKIYSEPGEGTSVKIYLPRTMASEEPDTGGASDSEPLPGDRQEVILVVDDEAVVRQFSADALHELGYRVVLADSAAAALRLIDTHPEIALLFTDIVMPDVNGRKLADAARLRRPDLKVLYTTGYTRNAVVHNGIVDNGVELIGKPFTVDELAAKVREVLDKV